MGTRNMTIVIHEGKPIVAQYCQWDGYPDGQGRTALEFLRNGFNREVFLERMKDTKIVSGDEFNPYYMEAIGYVPGDMIDLADSKKFQMRFPSLGRDLGARILEFIQTGRITLRELDFSGGKFDEKETLVEATSPLPLSLDPDFAKDTTWCEWIWTVDLDRNVFIGDDNSGRVNEWLLDALPTVDEMVASFQDIDDVDDEELEEQAEDDE